MGDGLIEPVREELSVLAPGGGLTIGHGCALPPETPADNMHAFVEAAHRHGRYRPDGGLAGWVRVPGRQRLLLAAGRFLAR